MKKIILTINLVVFLTSISTNAQTSVGDKAISINKIESVFFGKLNPKNVHWELIAPYIECSSKEIENKINTTISKAIFPIYTFGDIDKNYVINVPTPEYLKFEKERLEQLKIESHYLYSLIFQEIFLSHNITSFEFNIDEDSMAGINSSTFHLNIDVNTGEEIKVSDFIKDTISSPLLVKIETKIYKYVLLEMEDDDNKIFEKNMIRKMVIKNNIPLKKLPNGFFCKNSEGKEGFCFTIFNSFSHAMKYLDRQTNYFFSFEELRPYLKEDFKKRIGLQ